VDKIPDTYAYAEKIAKKRYIHNYQRDSYSLNNIQILMKRLKTLFKVTRCYLVTFVFDVIIRQVKRSQKEQALSLSLSLSWGDLTKSILYYALLYNTRQSDKTKNSFQRRFSASWDKAFSKSRVSIGIDELFHSVSVIRAG